MMEREKCVYTTLQSPWIEAAAKAKQPVTLWSSKSWKQAREMVKLHGSAPLLIRHSGRDAEGEMLHCHYQAKLTEVTLLSDFDQETPDFKRRWLEERLWLQKQWIAENWSKDKYERWQAQFEDWEISDKAQTWYTVQCVLRLPVPLPVSELVKVSDGQPLSADYGYGYAICYMPETE